MFAEIVTGLVLFNSLRHSAILGFFVGWIPLIVSIQNLRLIHFFLMFVFIAFGVFQFGETRRPIFLDLVPDAHIGDYVRVHVGFAVQQVEKSEAEQAYAKLAENGKWKAAEVLLEAALEADEALPESARRVKPR